MGLRNPSFVEVDYANGGIRMTYTITIDYFGVEVDEARIAAPICRLFAPKSSYVDLPVMQEGHPLNAEMQDGDTKDFGKSVYATNVDGWGKLDNPEPYASTSVPFPVPLAQFKVAMVGSYDEDRKCHTVTFSTDDYKEAFYYQQMGEALKEQGFVVTVQGGAEADAGAGAGAGG